MRTLIIYFSNHHKNTEKIAQAMGEVLEAKVSWPNKVEVNEPYKYDLIGFGSGIYFGKHHKTLIDLAQKFPAQSQAKAFIFSTNGIGNTSQHSALRQILKEKGFEIVGEFACKGWDEFGPFKIIGGLNKGRPNEQDTLEAKEFAQKIKQEYQKEP